MTESDSKLSVNLVLHELSRGWIIEKMASRLCAALRELGVDAAVSAQPSASAMINHFMIYHYVDPMPGTINTMGITHVDDASKIDMVRKHLATGVRAAICMSSMSVDQLADYRIDRRKLTYALPAHDCATTPRRIVIGITSQNYSDGRKRDWLLRRLSEDISLDDFEFRIFGRGWDEVASQLVVAGATVIVKEPSSDYRADYDEIKAAVPNFDYFFYPGLDEGTLGILDALSAGVKTIVTTQGFHLDIPNGITHGFWDYGELKQIFEEIAHERRARTEPARSLTWARYARRHLDIWSSLIQCDSLPPGDKLLPLGDELLLCTESRTKRNYPVDGYLAVMRNSYRRQVYLQLSWPKTYKTYLFARRKAGGVLRRLRGSHYWRVLRRRS